MTSQRRLPSSPVRRYGLLVAAGRGRRFGRAKQHQLLAGRPLWLHPARTLDRHPAIDGLVIVTNRGRLARVRQLCRANRLDKVIAVVPGGTLRTDSVRAGLAALPDSGLVAVHDAARPLLDPELLDPGFRLARRHGAATCGLPVTDTIKTVAAGLVTGTLDRTGLYAVQTPQFFTLELLRRAHALAARRSLAATDDCTLVELLGIRPAIVPGSALGIKVTGRADLEIIQRLI